MSSTHPVRWHPGRATRVLAAGLGLLALAAAAPAAPGPAERRELLEALRPAAARRVGQPVKFKVDRLNIDGRWALLTGELVTPAGTALAWERVAGCHPELDKMLWVVANRQAGRWTVKHLEVCASEPPHWSPEQFGGLVWPCGVYAGLQGPTGADLQAACRSSRAANRPQRRP